jgi:hypothetical protein
LVELKLGGENLKGGVLQVVVFASYPHRGVLSVHLLASTYDEDPEAEAIIQPADDDDEFVERAIRRWNSPGYQREVLGGQTMETYLEH